MNARIIKTESEYEAAVREIEKLMDTPEDDIESVDRLELLALLVQKYEDEHFPSGEVSPIDVVKFVMDQRGLAQKDLAPSFGSAARVSDFLSGRRGLSVSTILALNRDFHIPVDLLLEKAAIVRKPRGVTRAASRGSRRSPSPRPAARKTVRRSGKKPKKKG